MEKLKHKASYPKSGSNAIGITTSISMGVSLVTGKAWLARVYRPALPTIDRAENTPRSVSSGTQACIQYEWGKCRETSKLVDPLRISPVDLADER